MKGLTNADKLEIIIKLAREHKITSLQLAKGADMSEPAARALLNGKTQSPHTKTVDRVLVFIEDWLCFDASPEKANAQKDLILMLQRQLADKDKIIQLQDAKIKRLERAIS